MQKTEKIFFVFNQPVIYKFIKKNVYCVKCICKSALR